MPKIRSPTSSSSANEETTGLMTNAALGSLAQVQSKLPVALTARWQRVVAVVVVGCILLFVWESLEVDQTSGDVALKLHTGHKQQDGEESVFKPASPDDAGTTSSTSTGTTVPVPAETPVTDVDTKAATTDPNKEEASQPAAVTEPPSSVPVETPLPTPLPQTPLPTPIPATPLPTPLPVPATELPVPEPIPPPPPPPLAATEAPKIDPNTGRPDCTARCASPPPFNPSTAFGGKDMTVSSNMLQRLNELKAKWKQDVLTVQYGADNVDKIFEPTYNGEKTYVKDRAFVDMTHLNGWESAPPDPKDPNNPIDGRTRLVRKYTLKLYQVQSGMVQAQLRPAQQCLDACQESMMMAPGGGDPTFSKFVWANGGHSASAAHGDMYRESYTATLGRDVQPILGGIGLDFQVRNYAMVRTLVVFFLFCSV